MSRTNHLMQAVAIVAILGISLFASAAVYHSQTDNPMQNIPAVSDYQTTGADMAGMSVTALFSAAPPETVIWQATGADSGQAVGNDADWALSEQGDTFTSPWLLTYSGKVANKGLLTGFQIDGFAAGPGKVGVMFDRTFDGLFGTPGSFKGRDLELVGTVPFDVFVNYQGDIGVAGNPPVGDEFRWLKVGFAILPAAGEFDTVPPTVAGLDGVDVARLEFIQDSNNPIVPEPISLSMLGLGGLALLRRRR